MAARVISSCCFIYERDPLRLSILGTWAYKGITSEGLLFIFERSNWHSDLVIESMFIMNVSCSCMWCELVCVACVLCLSTWFKTERLVLPWSDDDHLPCFTILKVLFIEKETKFDGMTFDLMRELGLEFRISFLGEIYGA